MDKKQIGAAVYEKRGDDFYMVNTTLDGDIVEVQQYDAHGHRWEAVNFFAETAPKLVSLIEKAAGVKSEPVEYEYAMQMKDLRGEWVETSDPFIRLTSQTVIWSDRYSRERLIEWCKEEMGAEFRLVKRRKAGKVEVV